MKFEVGKTYIHGWICDSSKKSEVIIEKRTEKSVWVDGKRFKVFTDNGEEYIYPTGKYSMAPILNSTNCITGNEEVAEEEIKNEIENVDIYIDAKMPNINKINTMSENIEVAKEYGVNKENFKINKIVYVSNKDFEYISDNLLEDYKLLETINEPILLVNKEEDLALVIDTQGYNYCRYTSLFIVINKDVLRKLIDNNSKKEDENKDFEKIKYKAQKYIGSLNFDECLKVFEKIPTGTPVTDILFERMELLDNERFEEFLNDGIEDNILEEVKDKKITNKKRENISTKKHNSTIRTTFYYEDDRPILLN